MTDDEAWATPLPLLGFQIGRAISATSSPFFGFLLVSALFPGPAAGLYRRAVTVPRCGRAPDGDSVAVTTRDIVTVSLRL